MKANDLDAFAATLEQESAELDETISSGDLYQAQVEAARTALCLPRDRAAVALRQAANALRSIPPLGLATGAGKTS